MKARFSEGAVLSLTKVKILFNFILRTISYSHTGLSLGRQPKSILQQPVIIIKKTKYGYQKRFN